MRSVADKAGAAPCERAAARARKAASTSGAPAEAAGAVGTTDAEGGNPRCTSSAGDSPGADRSGGQNLDRESASFPSRAVEAPDADIAGDGEGGCITSWRCSDEGGCIAGEGGCITISPIVS